MENMNLILKKIIKFHIYVYSKMKQEIYLQQETIAIFVILILF